jgi:AcrR family transcriptional regulator
VTPRPDVSEERKAQIVEAAVAVFSRLGFERARMEDVARESGLSKGTLYLYYESKDELIGALLESVFDWGMRDLKNALASGGSASERLRKIGGLMSGEIEKLYILLPVWFEFYAVAARDEGVRRFMKSYFEEYREILAEIVHDGIQRGEFRQVDVEEVTVTLVSLFEGVTLLWAFDPKTVPIGSQIEASVRLLLEGLSDPRRVVGGA